MPYGIADPTGAVTLLLVHPIIALFNSPDLIIKLLQPLRR